MNRALPVDLVMCSYSSTKLVNLKAQPKISSEKLRVLGRLVLSCEGDNVKDAPRLVAALLQILPNIKEKADDLDASQETGQHKYKDASGV